MSDIFISYASSDREKAKILADVLGRQGWSVWWDREIPPGRSYEEVIDENLNAAKCVLVLWSKASVSSQWVKNEASDGLERNILVPALIEETKVSLAFRHLQAARITDWNGQMSHPEVDKLLKAIKVILGHGKREDKKHEDSTANKEKDSGQLRGKSSGYKVEVDVVHKSQSDKREKQPGALAGKSKLPWLLPAIIVPCIIGIVVYITSFRPTSKENPSKEPMKSMQTDEVKSKEKLETAQKAGDSAKVNKLEIELAKLTVQTAPLHKDDEYLTIEKVTSLYLDKDWKPQVYTVNDFEEKTINGNNVVIDKATGLTWQQSGSKEYMNYDKARRYILQLNHDKFAGYNDWRLPMLKEAITLLEQEKISDGLFIDSKFDKTQKWIWTSDLYGASVAWVVYFSYGYCYYGYFGLDNYVRAVR